MTVITLCAVFVLTEDSESWIHYELKKVYVHPAFNFFLIQALPICLNIYHNLKFTIFFNYLVC